MTDGIVTVLEGGPTTIRKEFAAIWRHRRFYRFLFQEISMKRYRRTVLGAWWLVVRPLIPAIVSLVVFTAVVPIETKGEPYPVFFFSSYSSWVLFQATLVLMPRAIVWLRSLMRRTYFPKLMIPLASIGPPLFEWLVTMTCFLVVVGYYVVTTGTSPIDPGVGLLVLPLATLLAMLFAVAIGTIVSVFAVFARDVIYTTPYFVQIFMLMTPVMYPLSFVPENMQWLVYVLNPMASIVQVTHYSLTGNGPLPWGYFAVSAVMVVSVFLFSVWFFLRAEPFISDAA